MKKSIFLLAFVIFYYFSSGQVRNLDLNIFPGQPYSIEIPANEMAEFPYILLETDSNTVVKPVRFQIDGKDVWLKQNSEFSMQNSRAGVEYILNGKGRVLMKLPEIQGEMIRIEFILLNIKDLNQTITIYRGKNFPAIQSAGDEQKFLIVRYVHNK